MSHRSNHKPRESLRDEHGVNRQSTKKSSQKNLLLKMLQEPSPNSRLRITSWRLKDQLWSKKLRRLSLNRLQSLSG